MLNRIHRSERPSQLSLLTPEDLRRANEADELHLDMNILDLYPDPVSFVRFLKDIDRVDISSDLFVKLLEVYRIHKSQASDPMRFVLRMISCLPTVFIHPPQDAPLPANNYTDANPAVRWKDIVEYTLQTCTFVILY